MARWNVAPVVSFLLLGLLLIIGMIQVLPQVDLPDTAFHEDTAPVVAKFRVTAAPTLISAIIPSTLQHLAAAPTDFTEQFVSPSLVSGNLVPIINCSLLC